MAKNRDIASSWQEFLEARKQEGAPLNKFRVEKKKVSEEWARIYEDDEFAPPDPVETWMEAKKELVLAADQYDKAEKTLYGILDILLRDSGDLTPEDKGWEFEEYPTEASCLLIRTFKEAKNPQGRPKAALKTPKVFDKEVTKAKLAEKGIVVTTTRTKADGMIAREAESEASEAQHPTIDVSDYSEKKSKFDRGRTR